MHTLTVPYSSLGIFIYIISFHLSKKSNPGLLYRNGPILQAFLSVRLREDEHFHLKERKDVEIEAHDERGNR